MAARWPVRGHLILHTFDRLDRRLREENMKEKRKERGNQKSCEKKLDTTHSKWRVNFTPDCVVFS